MKTILLSTFLFLFLNLNAQIDYFPPLQGDEWDTLSIEELGWCTDELDDLISFLESNDTKAFLILKDGKIVVEEYFQNMDMNTNHQWNSAGKTVTALLTGVAQENGLLSLDDKTSDYLNSGWTSMTSEQEDQITIRHQLSMTTGMDDSLDPFCTDPECLVYLADAGTRWAYHNGPYTLLADVIESASGQTINSFVNQYLKNKTGMNGAFIPLDYNKIYFSTPRSMARMGSLMLNQGVWDTTVVLGDMNFYNDLITPSQNLNESYGYLWWLSGYDSFMIPSSQFVLQGSITPNAPDDLYSALGKDSQILDILPSKNITVVRMGGAPIDDLIGLSFHNDMWEYLSAIFCEPTSIEENEFSKSLKIYPNPFREQLKIETDFEIKSIQLFNSLGQLISEVQNATEISGQNLSPGIYWLEVNIGDGRKVVKKVVKRQE